VSEATGDHRFETEAAEDRAQELRARAVLDATRNFADQPDLFDLAIEVRTVMLESHQLMMRATRLRREVQSEADRIVLSRIVEGALARHADTLERFQAIEIAMDTEARDRLWRAIM
jgi:hypothetical protein